MRHRFRDDLIGWRHLSATFNWWSKSADFGMPRRPSFSTELTAKFGAKTCSEIKVAKRVRVYENHWPKNALRAYVTGDNMAATTSPSGVKGYDARFCPSYG